MRLIADDVDPLEARARTRARDDADDVLTFMAAPASDEAPLAPAPVQVAEGAVLDLDAGLLLDDEDLVEVDPVSASEFVCPSCWLVCHLNNRTTSGRCRDCD